MLARDIMRSTYLSFLFLCFFILSCSQLDCEKYSDSYVPVDLYDALNYMDCTWSDEDKDKFSKLTEREAVVSAHFGIGLGIRNSWGFWRRDTEIANYFDKLDIHHPDDISSIILTSFHRHLNEKDIQLEEQIAYYVKYWEESNKKYLEKCKTEIKDFNLNDTIDFTYAYRFSSKEQEENVRNGNCLAKGVVLDKDTINFRLKIKLIECCEESGINIDIIDHYDTVDGKKVLLGKKAVIMKKNEVKWTHYSIWHYNYGPRRYNK